MDLRGGITLDENLQQHLVDAATFATNAMNALEIRFADGNTTNVATILTQNKQKNGISNILHGAIQEHLVRSFRFSWKLPVEGDHDLEYIQPNGLRIPSDIKTTSDFTVKGNRSWALNVDNPLKFFLLFNYHIEERGNVPFRVKIYLIRTAILGPTDFGAASAGQFCFLKESSYDKLSIIGSFHRHCSLKIDSRACRTRD